MRPLRGGVLLCGVRRQLTTDTQSASKRARERSSAKLERSAGPVCVGGLGPDAAAVALRPVGEVSVRSEPSLVRLLDNEKPGQLNKARERLSSFCRKLRRTISECTVSLGVHFRALVHCDLFHEPCNILLL